MRDVIVAANWKMHTTPADAGELARTIASRTREPGVIRVICPPYVCLAAVRDALAAADPDVGVERRDRIELAAGCADRALQVRRFGIEHAVELAAEGPRHLACLELEQRPGRPDPPEERADRLPVL